MLSSRRNLRECCRIFAAAFVRQWAPPCHPLLLVMLEFALLLVNACCLSCAPCMRACPDSCEWCFRNAVAFPTATMKLTDSSKANCNRKKMPHDTWCHQAKSSMSCMVLGWSGKGSSSFWNLIEPANCKRSDYQQVTPHSGWKKTDIVHQICRLQRFNRGKPGCLEEVFKPVRESCETLLDLQ